MLKSASVERPEMMCPLVVNPEILVVDHQDLTECPLRPPPLFSFPLFF